MGKGFVVVRAFTSRGAIPVEDVSVTILNRRSGSEELRAYRNTDSSGRTVTVPLEAPDRALSQKPDMPRPFSTYTIRVDHPFYKTVTIQDVQIFDTETSLQELELIPLQEHANPGQRQQSFQVTPQQL